VHVVLSFKAKPDKVADLKKLLLGLVKSTQAEPGCIMYDLFQNKTDPNNLTYIEEWTTQEALDTHRNTAHVKAALAALPPLIAEAPDDRFYVLAPR
jgi:quinol monooxygenase YgiN